MGKQRQGLPEPSFDKIFAATKLRDSSLHKLERLTGHGCWVATCGHAVYRDGKNPKRIATGFTRRWKEVTCPECLSREKK
jgi:hypothetical protein